MNLKHKSLILKMSQHPNEKGRTSITLDTTEGVEN